MKNNLLTNEQEIEKTLYYCEEFNEGQFYDEIKKNLNIYDEDLFKGNENNIQTINSILILKSSLSKLIDENKQILKIYDNEIQFSLDTWDFTKNWIPGLRKSAFIISFKLNSKKQISLFIIMLKCYCIYNMGIYDRADGWVRTTKNVKSVLSKLTNIGCYSFDEITIDDIKRIETTNDVANQKLKSHLKSILNFYYLITGKEINKDIYLYLTKNNTASIKKQKENNKTKLISTKLYNAVYKMLIKVFSDESMPILERAVAGLNLILSQTGIRSSEVLILRYSDLVIYERGSIKSAYLNYRGTKSTKIGKNYTESSVFANNIVVSIINELKRFNFGVENINNYLLPSDNNEPLSEEKFRRITVKIFNYHKDEIFKETGGEYKILDYRDYRVYVTSELLSRGIPAILISKMHYQNAPSMVGYYGRPDHPIQEDILFSKNIIKEICEDKLTILGPKGKLDNQAIDKLVENNCKKSIDEIIEEAAGVLPIRSTKGGFCMKLHPVKECEGEYEIRNIMCAFGACPNRVHLYFNLKENLDKAISMNKILEYDISLDEDDNYRNETQKQAYLLNNILKDIIFQELNELDKELKRLGKDHILNKHPELEKIINDRDSVDNQIKLMKDNIRKVIK